MDRLVYYLQSAYPSWPKSTPFHFLSLSDFFHSPHFACYVIHTIRNLNRQNRTSEYSAAVIRFVTFSERSFHLFLILSLRSVLFLCGFFFVCHFLNFFFCCLVLMLWSVFLDFEGWFNYSIWLVFKRLLWLLLDLFFFLSLKVIVECCSAIVKLILLLCGNIYFF